MKLDPYINVDPDDSPYQHGEVYIWTMARRPTLTRSLSFVRTRLSRRNATTGRIYANVLRKERRGDCRRDGR